MESCFQNKQMCKIVILGPLQQQVEALGTQYRQVYDLYNDEVFVRNKNEMISSDRVIYRKYSAINARQEIVNLQKLLKEISPDVVYANGFRELWIVGFLKHIPGLLPKKPVVLVTSHNSLAWQKASKRLMIALSCYLFADGIFALATFQENWLRKYGISPRKIKKIPNAVDIEEFSPTGPSNCFADIFQEVENYPIIVNIANVERLKGQDLLIRSVNQIKKEINTVRLVFIGEQGYDLQHEQLLKKLIAEYGLEKNVFFLGNVDHNLIPGFIRSADLTVISSWNEVCPFTLLESLSVGRVTISTAVGGIPEIIKDKINGFLVNPGDVQGFVDCILNISNDPSLRMSIEKKARLTAIENYSYSIIGKEHKDFITSIMQNKS
jgi:glycosyltransferase involved in cell wall biosynthesis